MRRTVHLILAAAVIVTLSCPPRRAPRHPGAAFTLAMEGELLTLDPHLEDESVTHSTLCNIYDPLVAFDPQMRIAPALAASWENPDELTWRFRLRPGVVFHHGAPFTAADVKYSLDRARGLGVGYYLGTVKEVKVIDDLTVDIITTKPSPVLLNKLTFIAIVPQWYAGLAARPAGTGAYKFVSYQKGQSLLLAARASYWGGEPAIKNVVMRFIPAAAERARALAKGEVLLARDITEANLENAGPHNGITLAKSPSLAVSFLGVNFTRRSPLASRAVREAIYWALDPQQLLAENKLDAMPSDQFVSPYIVGYLPSDRARRPDLARAKKLLAAAGYPKGGVVNLEVTTVAMTKSGPVIVRQLGAAGIRVNLKPYEWPELSERLNKRQSQFFLVGWGCSSGDASDLFDACLHTPDGKNYGQANWGGYSDRALDRLIEQSGSTLDNRQRIKLMHQAMRMVSADLPLIPLYAKNRTYGYRDDVAFTPRQDGRIKLIEIGYRE
ncbi:MAG: ABC transporter substrate-binding protein [Candidatus Edwardsbacteria bacterium]|nr:ABC transporter substrate-binding protein [Candidatus Edwardsbacteria bacterium]